MSRHFTKFSLVLWLAAASPAIYGHGTGRTPFPGVNDNPVVGNFGAPVNCTRCHTTFAPANSDPAGSVRLTVGPYTPGRTQTLRVTVSHPEGQRWGFQLSAHIINNPTQPAGILTPNDDVAVVCGTEPTPPAAPCQPGVLQFASHRNGDPGTRRGQSGSGSWEFEWAPPTTDVGDVIFYVAGNAANNNGNNQGDRIYTASARVQVTGACPITPRQPSLRSVVNAASFEPGMGYNSMISIFGLGFAEPGVQRAAGPGDFRDGKFPDAMACVAVEVAGRRVPVTFVKTDQINAQAPTLDLNGPVEVRVILNPGLPNEVRTVPATGIAMRTVSPAFFLFGTSKSIAAQHSDFSLLADPAVVPGATPARPGESVILYGTGFGITNPVYQAGELPGGLARLRDAFTVTIGGVTLRPEDIAYAGLSPGSISGLYQLNLRIPDSAPDGNVPVEIRVGGVASQAGTTIPVKR
ncbi:MAG: choice-of-anchor V domain-containing protein [Acidobacteriota bacterium]